ncbi:MAG TPA: hypothetical protein PLD88_08645, partial [Candidatus Berkiella sp.]|nr:hypothetical protein [Candidatus Berkiella sp.]
NEMPDKIASIKKQLAHFDISAAQELTAISNPYFAAKQQLLTLPKQQAVLQQALADLDKNIEAKTIALNAVEDTLSAKTEEIQNLELQTIERRKEASKAKKAYENYDIKLHQTETFNRGIAKKNMQETQNAVELLNMDISRLNGQAKLIKAEVAKLNHALGLLLPEQTAMSKELNTIDAQLVKANGIIKTILSTLKASVVGSEVLQQSNKLLHQIKTVENEKTKAITQLKEYSEEIKALAQHGVTAKTTSTPLRST